MPHLLKTWTSEEIAKMNEESFLVDLLDTLQFSPELGSNDQMIDLMKKKLDVVEAHIQQRLDSK